jgi:hypothetical protein
MEKYIIAAIIGDDKAKALVFHYLFNCPKHGANPHSDPSGQYLLQGRWSIARRFCANGHTISLGYPLTIEVPPASPGEIASLEIKQMAPYVKTLDVTALNRYSKES